MIEQILSRLPAGPVRSDVPLRAGEGMALVEGFRGDVMAWIKGDAAVLLQGERVALNLLQRMCGVATLTSAFVREVEGTRAVIVDTRKTTPG